MNKDEVRNLRPLEMNPDDAKIYHPLSSPAEVARRQELHDGLADFQKRFARSPEAARPKLLDGLAVWLGRRDFAARRDGDAIVVSSAPGELGDAIARLPTDVAFRFDPAGAPDLAVFDPNRRAVVVGPQNFADAAVGVTYRIEAPLAIARQDAAAPFDRSPRAATAPRTSRGISTGVDGL